MVYKSAVANYGVSDKPQSPPRLADRHTVIRDGNTFFGGYTVTNTSAIRFPLTLANALAAANPFEVEAALIVVRDLALRAPPYLMLVSRAAEDAILAAGSRPDSSATVLARQALSRFVKEMELHEYAEQHAARD